jgi:hypothetical protein
MASIGGALVLVALGAAAYAGHPGRTAGPVAGAASCAASTPGQELRAARVVFTGVMLPGPADGTGELLSPARVRVSRYLKGHGPSVVRVQTAIQRSGNGYEENSEGINPHAGQRWKIYSSSAHRPYPTSDCDGSRLISGRRQPRWASQAVPRHQGELSGVSCASARACVAVGLTFMGPRSGDSAFAERWDGRRWRVQSTPDPVGLQDSSLVAVSCSSSAACTAVGESDNSNVGHFVPLVERWGGRRWSIQHVPHGNNWYLYGVSCPSARVCFAVGLGDDRATHQSLALAERWDGRHWSVQRAAQPAAAHSSWLYGISCPSPEACTAVGFYYQHGSQRALAERWDGHRWSVQKTPDPTGGDSTLQNVSCVSARACTAVGEHATPRLGGAALAERWNGRRWLIQATPAPSGTQSRVLYGVACASGQECVGAGAAYSGFEQSAALAERWSGNRWRTGNVRPPARMPSYLHGVSCPGPRVCVAVGDYGYDHGPYTPLIERYS